VAHGVRAGPVPFQLVTPSDRNCGFYWITC